MLIVGVLTFLFLHFKPLTSEPVHLLQIKRHLLPQMGMLCLAIFYGIPTLVEFCEKTSRFKRGYLEIFCKIHWRQSGRAVIMKSSEKNPASMNILPVGVALRALALTWLTILQIMLMIATAVRYLVVIVSGILAVSDVCKK